MNLKTNIRIEGKNTAIVAHNAVNNSEIEIKIFAGYGFGVEDLTMNVPLSSAQRVTEQYLKMCGEKLIKAQEWND